MIYRCLNLGSLNLKVSPFLHKDGDLLRCVNFEKDQVGALKKRPGYVTYLGTANGSTPLDLFTWQKDDGTTFYNYRNSGGLLYYSAQGTSEWTLCGNGTVTADKHIGHAVLENTLIVGQAGGTTRHTTSGTAFTDTTSAPAEEFLVSKYNRIWAGGTSSNWYYSTAGTPTDWTSDSSSIKIPGAGKVHGGFVANDKIVVPKNSGMMFTYDDYNLRQVPTDMGPSSPYSLAQREDYWFSLNRLGFFGYSGDRPKIISNPIEKQVYNDADTGIAGTSFDSAPGGIYRYDYFCAVGSVTDDFTNETVSNCIEKYDYQLDEWSNYSFSNFPTAFNTYKDANGDEKFIFGASGGQCYTFGGTALSDNGNPIESIAEGFLHFGEPEIDKYFTELWAFSSPGCQATLQIAISDTFNRNSLNWQNVGSLSSGCKHFGFPPQSRGKFLFYRIHEFSKDSRFTFYGFAVNLEGIGARR
jgi:hypothetical protein